MIPGSGTDARLPGKSECGSGQLAHVCATEMDLNEGRVKP
jgi:hypothetical protein